MRAKLTSGTTLLAVAILVLTSGCYESGDYPTDFIVLSSTPANSQTNVSQNAQIILRFSNAVDHQTIQGTKQIILVDSTNAVIPTTFTFEGELLYVNPLSPLGTGGTYGIAVRPGVRDIFGSNVKVPWWATFSTGTTVSSIPNFPPFSITPPGGPTPGGTSGTYSQTGPLVYARARHRATRLIDGRVLATGGENDGPLGRVLRSAEIFDPATLQWNLSTSLGTGINGMNYERYGHTSTLLKDGRVLIAGGADNHKILNVAEIYNPTHDVFSVVPARMVETRAFHTAERLEGGNVLLICGWCNYLVPNAASLSGWGTISYLLDSIEVFDVFAGTFTMAANRLLPRVAVNANRQQWWTNPGTATSAGRMYHTSSYLPDGSIMICGGYGDPWLNQALSTDDAQFYQPSLGGSGVMGNVAHCGTNLSVPRVCHTANVIPNGDAAGLVVLFGGFCNSPYQGVLASGEVFDYTHLATAGIWTGDAGCFTPLAQQMNNTRHNHTGNVILQGATGGGVLLAGGARHLPVMNWNPPTPYARFYPWLEPTGCGACRLNTDSDVFHPFGFGKSTTNPYRGINITGEIKPTQDPTGTVTDLTSVFTQGVYFHSGTSFPNGTVLLAGGAWCPFCLFGPNAWSTYFTGIVGNYRTGGPSCIYNP
ncbi:MAG: Ig-like domain-containing protein [Planctomycetota bacterium]|jgi:hypothetical protein